MKHFFNTPVCLLPLAATLWAVAPLSFAGSASADSVTLPAASAAVDSSSAEPVENIIVLDEVAVKNLGLQTVQAVPRPLEQTAFALGAIEPRPESVARVSSRISGRVVGLSVFPGDVVRKGDVVAQIESRLPGSPPQAIDLVAPLGGTVTTLDVRLGDPVEPDRPLMQITDLNNVLAVARVPEHLAGRMSAGATARIRIPALGGETLEGSLVRFGTLADAASGTVDAYFTLANTGHRIVPGMRAEFSIVLGAREGVVSVPRIAVQGQGGARFVFVTHFELPNAFVKVPVVLGESNDRYVEILSGLFPGDEVVTTGAYALSFAGGGSLSLKEALDAAHGHAHNEDGSEVSGSDSGEDGHSHGEEDGHGAFLWQVISGVLFIALLGSLWGRRRVVEEEPAEDTEIDSADGEAALAKGAAHGMREVSTAHDGEGK